MKEYDIYLFDADGTVIDTADHIYNTYKNTCMVYGAPEPQKEAIIDTIGMPLRPQMELFIGKLSDEDYEKAQAVHMEFQLAHFKKYIKTFPLIEETLSELCQRGKRCGVVTSRRRASVSTFLEHTGLLQYFDHLVCPEDTEHHKPHPEPVEKACELFGEGRVIFIGDARFDIESGTAAGVDTAFVSWSRSSLKESAAQPTWILESPQDLLKDW